MLERATSNTILFAQDRNEPFSFTLGQGQVIKVIGRDQAKMLYRHHILVSVHVSHRSYWLRPGHEQLVA